MQHRNLITIIGASALVLTACGGQVDVKPEGAYATAAQRSGLSYDPCPGQVIDLGAADPIWCGRYVRKMSEDDKAAAREDMAKMMSASVSGSLTTTAPTEAPTEPAPTATEAPPVDEFAGVHPFGKTVTTGGGNAITVGKPEKFKPSKWAMGGSGGLATKFEVTFTNKTSEPVDLAMFGATASHDDAEAESILDSERDITGPPSTAVRPGKTVKFAIVFDGAPDGTWNVDIDGGGDTIMFSTEEKVEEKVEKPSSKPAKAKKKDAPGEESEWVKGQREWAEMTESERAAERDMNEAVTAPEGDVGADDIDPEEEMGDLVTAPPAG